MTRNAGPEFAPKGTKKSRTGRESMTVLMYEDIRGRLVLAAPEIESPRWYDYTAAAGEGRALADMILLQDRQLSPRGRGVTGQNGFYAGGGRENPGEQLIAVCDETEIRLHRSRMGWAGRAAFNLPEG